MDDGEVTPKSGSTSASSLSFDTSDEMQKCICCGAEELAQAHAHAPSSGAMKQCSSAQFLTLQIDRHLNTMKTSKKLLDKAKALRYTSRLDDIHSAEQKRKKELTEVTKHLQKEEKKLQERLLNFETLISKVSARQDVLKKDHLTLQHLENRMEKRLQALKEKEIFVNCQMAEVHQETAIQEWNRELQKLACLIFKTDLSKITFKEFQERVRQMQMSLKKRYSKIKLLEHYCQRHHLPSLGFHLDSMEALTSDAPGDLSVDTTESTFDTNIATNASQRPNNLQKKRVSFSSKTNQNIVKNESNGEKSGHDILKTFNNPIRKPTTPHHEPPVSIRGKTPPGPKPEGEAQNGVQTQRCQMSFKSKLSLSLSRMINWTFRHLARRLRMIFEDLYSS